MERAHCAVIQAKECGDDVLRQLQRRYTTISGDGVDPFSLSAFFEKEHPAIQGLVNLSVRIQWFVRRKTTTIHPEEMPSGRDGSLPTPTDIETCGSGIRQTGVQGLGKGRRDTKEN